MRVEWSEKAEWNRDPIGDYICERFGYKRMEKYIEEVDQTIGMIMRTPNIGSIDPLFRDHPIAYRSVIINSLSKMVYYVQGDTIRIAAFWDTRQEPKTQARQVT